LPLLKGLVRGKQKAGRSFGVRRSAALVLAGYGRAELEYVRTVAAESWGDDLALVMKILRRVRGLEGVSGRVRQRMQLVFDPVRGREYLDMRAVVAARLLNLSDADRVRQAIQAQVKAWRKRCSEFERNMLRRLFPE
jgi:hypothetical protein